ncbi:hypothetical protein TI05_05675 [Achromatium sp. WMS3]|nr:hypothetical protein TI05_05675 [Achromatium sp. WMS3]
MHTFMILPNKDPAKICLLKIPVDYEGHEAFRHVTGLIAAVENNNPNYTYEDIMENLESQGYERIPFILGPSQD